LSTTENREFALATACCLWPPSPVRRQAIASAAAGAIDWARFLRVVKRHRVPGLVWNGLSEAGIEVPADIARTLKAGAGRTARASLASCAEAIRLQRLFEQAGLACAFLKGATVAKLAYGDLGIRHAKDIDMVVPDVAFSAACDLLASAGYRRTMPAGPATKTQLALWRRHGKDMEWRHEGKDVELELHWRLSSFSFLFKEPMDFARLYPVQVIPGAALKTLPQPDLFIYLCVHGASHAWCRLKWLADINALVAGRPAAAIEAYYQAAKDRGADRPVGQALSLCVRLFGLQLPQSVASDLSRSPAILLLTRMALHAMMRGGAETEIYDLPFGTTLMRLSHMLMPKNWRERFVEAIHQSISLEDTIALPLPKSLSFLYVLLRWPLWLFRRLSHTGASVIK
jgi:hypothetical protein